MSLDYSAAPFMSQIRTLSQFEKPHSPLSRSVQIPKTNALIQSTAARIYPNESKALCVVQRLWLKDY
jgi:hypothetical protein